jgi:hypothetical protein
MKRFVDEDRVKTLVPEYTLFCRESHLFVLSKSKLQAMKTPCCFLVFLKTLDSECGSLMLKPKTKI